MPICPVVGRCADRKDIGAQDKKKRSQSSGLYGSPNWHCYWGMGSSLLEEGQAHLSATSNGEGAELKDNGTEAD